MRSNDWPQILILSSSEWCHVDQKQGKNLIYWYIAIFTCLYMGGGPVALIQEYLLEISQEVVHNRLCLYLYQLNLAKIVLQIAGGK